MSAQDGDITVSLHGPMATLDDMLKASRSTKVLLKAASKAAGHGDVDWQLVGISFKCDGCGLRRPNRPGPDEGWTYSDGDDFCPSCTTEREGPSMNPEVSVGVSPKGSTTEAGADLPGDEMDAFLAICHAYFDSPLWFVWCGEEPLHIVNEHGQLARAEAALIAVRTLIAMGWGPSC